jgi:hypothetical protein
VGVAGLGNLKRRAVGYSVPLLDRMGQFVQEEAAAGRDVRRRLSGAEHHVTPTV